MPLNSTRGAASAKGFGLTAGAPAIEVDYLVVAGGGSAGGGAGGAGGYRTSFPGGTKIKLAKGVTVPVTIGAGAPQAPPSAPGPTTGANGQDSIFSTITSTAGGGSTFNAAIPASPGGSGGGGSYAYPPGGPGVNITGGTGNSPPTSPPQGNPGGNGNGYNIQCEDTNGGGGGASSAGGTITGAPLGTAGAGGNGSGVPTDFVPASYGTPGPSPTIRYFAGGGGGLAAGTALPVPSGGYGGGGNGQAFGRSAFCGAPPQGPVAGSSGTVNTGGGGGGGIDPNVYAGGSGIVLIRVPAADASKENFTLAPGTNTLVTNPDGSKTAVFTVSGSIKQN